MKTKLTTKKYYRPIESCHVTGDIWMNLPTLGILKPRSCSGLVITPACDLANAKVETVTYLPVIPIKKFLVSRAFYYDIRSALMGIAKEKISNIDEILLRNRLPSNDDVVFLRELLKETKPSNKKEEEIVKRIDTGFNMLSDILNPQKEDCNIQELRFFLGEKNYNGLITKLIRNSHSNDLHFLPADNEPAEWSSIPHHSVVLFRYPITIPIEVFDIANDPNCIDWKSAMVQLNSIYPISQHFKEYKPLKTCTVNQEFLTDLLTRFVGLFVRIGSPDFTNETINDLVKEI